MKSLYTKKKKLYNLINAISSTEMFAYILMIKSVQFQHSCSRVGGTVSQDDWLLGRCDALQASCQPTLRDHSYVAAKTLFHWPQCFVQQQISKLLSLQQILQNTWFCKVYDIFVNITIQYFLVPYFNNRQNGNLKSKQCSISLLVLN